jgi:hypothetical protein
MTDPNKPITPPDDAHPEEDKRIPIGPLDV